MKRLQARVDDRGHFRVELGWALLPVLIFCSAAVRPADLSAILWAILSAITQRATAEVYPPKEGLPAEGGFTRRRRVYPPKEGLPACGGPLAKFTRLRRGPSPLCHAEPRRAGIEGFLAFRNFP